MIPLTTKGCIGNASLKLGNVFKNGKNSDLSLFGVDVYEWQSVKVVAKNKTAKVYINTNLVYELSFAEDIGEVVGTSLYFSGTGSVDYLNFLDRDKKLVYAEEFE